MIDPELYTHLTFDCYGTLIDWESGILGALEPVLKRHGVGREPADLLASYARHEAEIEAGPYRRYRDVLVEVMNRICADLGLDRRACDSTALADSIGRWPPFPDAPDALRRLAQGRELAVISNVDDAMFAESERRLGVRFDVVVTAEQVGSYKPSLRNFQAALQRLRVPPERVLHVAQSIYHDHVPAKALGLTTVWVRRPSILPGTGLAPEAAAEPDAVVGDLGELSRMLAPETV